VNQDRLVRHRSGYAGQHGEDFLFANDEWFRGVALAYGPDGGVFVSDWSDNGECHDNKEDAIERTNGRIHKVAYGEPKRLEPFDLAKLDDAALVRLLLHKNEWYVRRARRLLQERSDSGASPQVVASLHEMLEQSSEVPQKLRALFTLHAIDALPEDQLLELTSHRDENLRGWAVRLLNDHREASPKAMAAMADLAAKDDSALVRLELASALQRIPHEARWEIATGLVSHAEDADDTNLQLMIWYGVAPLAADASRSAKLLADSKLPIIRRHLARRMAAR
jgi:hypothetical protein